MWTNSRHRNVRSVIPAKAGIQALRTFLNRKFKTWIPTSVGMTVILSSLCLAAPYPFPVPFVAKQHNAIFFTDLPGAGSIRIFTISGEEVIRIVIAPGEGIKPWNVRNSSGKDVATGVYLYLIDAGGEKTTGKLVIIR